MSEQIKTSELNRYFAGICFGGFILWQIYIIFTIFRTAPLLIDLYSDFGGGLPVITEFYIDWHQWALIVPIVSLLLSVDVIRRTRINKIYAISAFIFVVLITYVMQGVLAEAFFAPMIKMASSIDI